MLISNGYFLKLTSLAMDTLQTETYLLILRSFDHKKLDPFSYGNEIIRIQIRPAI